MIETQSIGMAAHEDPLLDPYRTLRTPEKVNNRRMFVVQGEKSIRRLLSSPCRVVSLLVTPRFLERIRPWLEDRKEVVRVYLGESEEVKSVIGYQMYQEVMAVAEIPECPSLESVLMTSPRPWFFVMADGLSNAENMGTLIRNCSGFGVTGLISGKSSCSPFLRRSVRCTMGTLFNLPIIESTSLVDDVKLLRERGVSIVGTFPHANQVNLSSARLEGDCCLVFGAEGAGMSPELTAYCDQSVTIPMHRGTDSLNVASASAVFLYEVNRQRGIS